MDDWSGSIWPAVINIKKDVCVINNVHVWRLCTNKCLHIALMYLKDFFGYGDAGGNDFVVEIL